MISHDLMYIIVFEVSNNVPIYASCFEDLEDVFLGTFELRKNGVFREMWHCSQFYGSCLLPTTYGTGSVNGVEGTSYPVAQGAYAAA